MGNANLLQSPLFGLSQARATKKLFWRVAYDLLASTHGDAFRTMNFGYAGGAELALEPRDKEEALCLQLYRQVVSGTSLERRDVLEVGCGRGGGASFVARYLGPRRVVGLDLAPRAIRLCRRLHAGVPNLEFVAGDAEDLPFEPETFDVVLNVESLHCYPRPERFFAGARRVLRPGGHLLLADLTRDFARIEALLGASGLVLLEREEITRNVLLALELDTERRLALSREAPAFARRQLQALSGVRGSPLYEALRAGRYSYVRFVLQRPAS